LGETSNSLEVTQFKTPYNKQIDAQSRQPWCYQVKKECYLDSLVICCRRISGTERLISISFHWSQPSVHNFKVGISTGGMLRKTSPRPDSNLHIV
jgi:hypothetical protein